MEQYFIRFTDGGKIHQVEGACKERALARLVVDLTSNAKRGLVIVNGRYGSGGLRVLGTDFETYPVHIFDCDFVHDQAKHEEWKADQNDQADI